MIIYIVFLFILLGTIGLFLFMRREKNEREILVQSTISWLYIVLNDLFYSSHIQINYQIKEAKYITYVEEKENNRCLNIVIWDKVHQRMYTRKELLHTAIKELMANKAPLLIKKAYELQYYD